MSCALVPTAARRLSVPVPDQDQDTASRPATKRAPSPAALAVWEVEDGRCEACGRPMDRACARIGRDSCGEHRLVCPDCKAARPILWRRLSSDRRQPGSSRERWARRWRRPGPK
jgi:hypothetical protein